MTFNNDTNIVAGNKHNNEQQHEHRTGRLTPLFFVLLEIF